MKSGSATGIFAFCRDLHRRALIKGSHPPIRFDTAAVAAEDALVKLPPVLYSGFDPTANSFHVGNLLVLSSLIRSSLLFGCRPIALIGGATGLIGDPSGRSTDRSELSKVEVHANTDSLTKQVIRLVENVAGMGLSKEEPSLRIFNNIDWYEKMPMIDFLRMARGFRGASMLRLGPIKARLGDGRGGVSFTEFSYQILQAHDWQHLSKTEDCFFQLGGSDQLGNLEAGYEHIRDQGGLHSAAGVCLPTLIDDAGRKLGKSTGASPSLWLDPLKTSPFAFYQYFRQLHDNIAEQMLRFFSLRPINEVEALIIEHNNCLGKWIAQKALAEEIVQLVHGREGFDKAISCSKILFEGSISTLETLDPSTITQLFGPASTHRLPVSSTPPLTMGELADRTQVDPRKQRGSHLMTKGAFYVNGQRVIDPKAEVRMSELALQGRFTLIGWGKRSFSLVEWVE